MELPVRFEWDEEKAEDNMRQHGVQFSEAEEVFDDPDGVESFDTVHSDAEARYQIIGWSSRRVLFVVFTELDDRGDNFRLISARRATRKERKFYETQTS